MKSTTLGLIPARGGSKGIPRKNLQPLAGRPLVEWTLKSAQESMLITDVVLSTDDEDIAEIGRRRGLSVPFMRPGELADDTSSTVDVAIHALEWLEKNANVTYDYLVLLEPTSPIRLAGQIDHVIETLRHRKNDFDAVVTVGEYSEHPALAKQVVGQKLQPLFGNDHETSRRQELVSAYFPFGVAYAVKVETFILERTFYPNRTSYFFLDPYQRVEIDTFYDLRLAEFLIEATGAGS